MPTLRGQVKEKWSGKPVSSAVVNVNGTQVLTDNNGYFLVNTPAVNVTLRVIHVNHEMLSESLMLSTEDNQIEITLTPTVGAL